MARTGWCGGNKPIAVCAGNTGSAPGDGGQEPTQNLRICDPVTRYGWIRGSIHKWGRRSLQCPFIHWVPPWCWCVRVRSLSHRGGMGFILSRDCLSHNTVRLREKSPRLIIFPSIIGFSLPRWLHLHRISITPFCDILLFVLGMVLDCVTTLREGGWSRKVCGPGTTKEPRYLFMFSGKARWTPVEDKTSPGEKRVLHAGTLSGRGPPNKMAVWTQWGSPDVSHIINVIKGPLEQFCHSYYFQVWVQAILSLCIHRM